MNKSNKGVKSDSPMIFRLVNTWLWLKAGLFISFLEIAQISFAQGIIEYSTFTERRFKMAKSKNIKIQPAGGVYKNHCCGIGKNRKLANSGGLSIIGGGTESKTTHFSTIVLPNDSTLRPGQ